MTFTPTMFVFPNHRIPLKIDGKEWNIVFVKPPLKLGKHTVCAYTDFENNEIKVGLRGDVISHILHELHHLVGETAEIDTTSKKFENFIEKSSGLIEDLILSNTDFFSELIMFMNSHKENIKEGIGKIANQALTELREDYKRRQYELLAAKHIW